MQRQARAMKSEWQASWVPSQVINSNTGVEQAQADDALTR